MPKWLIVVLVFLFVGICMVLMWRARRSADTDKDHSGVWKGGDGLRHSDDEHAS